MQGTAGQSGVYLCCSCPILLHFYHCFRLQAHTVQTIHIYSTATVQYVMGQNVLRQLPVEAARQMPYAEGQIGNAEGQAVGAEGQSLGAL